MLSVNVAPSVLNIYISDVSIRRKCKTNYMVHPSVHSLCYPLPPDQESHLVSRCTLPRGPPRSRVLHATSQRAGAPPSPPGLSPRPGLHSRWSSSNSPGKQGTLSGSATATCPLPMSNVLSLGMYVAQHIPSIWKAALLALCLSRASLRKLKLAGNLLC